MSIEKTPLSFCFFQLRLRTIQVTPEISFAKNSMLSENLALFSETLSIVIYAKPTCRSGLSIRILFPFMQKTWWLLDAGALLNLVSRTLVSSTRQHTVKHKPQLGFKTASKPPLQVEKIICIVDLFGPLSVRFWFSVVPNIAAYMQLGTLCVTQFIHQTSSASTKIFSNASTL